jgi:hypothetical protein
MVCTGCERASFWGAPVVYSAIRGKLWRANLDNIEIDLFQMWMRRDGIT